MGISFWFTRFLFRPIFQKHDFGAEQKLRVHSFIELDNYYKEAANMIIQLDNEIDTWKANYVADQLGK